MPRLPNETVHRIAKGARTGNVDDMLTLSMMYSVGLGVPSDSDMAMAWSSFSLLQPSFIDFKDAVRRLRKDTKSLPNDGFQYPEILDRIYDTLLPKYKTITPDELPKGKFTITPLLAGLRVFIVYRVCSTSEDEKLCYLYDMRVGGVNGERLSLELANKLEIPNYLGAIRGEPTIPDYPDRMKDVVRGPSKYFVIGGTLVVPSSKKPFIRKALPHVKTTSQLFDHFVSTVDDVRRPFADSEDLRVAKKELDESESVLEQLNAGNLYSDLNAQYKKSVATLKRAKRSGKKDREYQLRSDIRMLKEQAEKIKKGSLKKELKKRISSLETDIENLELENREAKCLHFAQYPENLFQFVTTEIYSGAKGNTDPIPVGRHLYAHLQSLGFTTFSSDLLGTYGSVVTKKQMDRKSFPALRDKFAQKYPEYTVSGLILRPDEETVKKKRKYSVYVVS